MDKRPIGIFDSGLGGLTVLKELRKKLPKENFVYLGDTARVPYGTRSKETVAKFSLQDVKFLKTQNVKCIVIACNTASSLARDDVQKSIDIPVFDVVTSGAEMAHSTTKNKIVGVIGTRATIKSNSFQDELGKLDPIIRVYQIAIPLLVPFIEEGEIDGEILKLLLNKYLKYFQRSDIDTLILGCTHYPIIEKEIGKVLGDKIFLINPAVRLSYKLSQFLLDKNLLASNKTGGKMEYFVTDLTVNFLKVAEMFLEDKLSGKVEKVNLE